MDKSQEPKRGIAFVHDFLVSYGGAERVLESLIKLDPKAPIFVLLADERIVRERFPERDIRTSFLQKMPRFVRKRYRWLLPFFAVAAESMDFRDFDTVISSSGAWSKGIVTRLRTTHIAYLHSPMRYLWDANERYFDIVRAGIGRRFFGRLLLSYLRVWDREAAERPDMLVSNSEYTRARVSKYYRRESAVILPPVALAGRFPGVPGSDSREDFFLIVARLTESKGVDAAMDAFDKLGLPLRIVGEGRERARLERHAGKSVRFEGAVDDATLASLYVRARAVIVPSEEDFGLAAAEAISFGTPVISLDQGGSLEVIKERKTGEFFRAATPEVIAAAVRMFIDRGNDAYHIDLEATRERFSEERFLSEWRKVLAGAGSDTERV
ncbi:MAG: glycosyltransferase family 4 protein [Candidatus Moranbacteria bacterium]|nr:glycosyltransferase family 4 protein [Candidatus Moranbacteria bacterium]